MLLQLYASKYFITWKIPKHYPHRHWRWNIVKNKDLYTYLYMLYVHYLTKILSGITRKVYTCLKCYKIFHSLHEENFVWLNVSQKKTNLDEWTVGKGSFLGVHVSCNLITGCYLYSTVTIATVLRCMNQRLSILIYSN